MAAIEEVKIPIIDFSKSGLEPGTTQWESTKAQVFSALAKYGCFEAMYDKVPNETQNAMFDILKESFSVESKLDEFLEKLVELYNGKLPIQKINKRRPTVDLILPDNVETFANTLWPHGNPSFCNTLKSFYDPLVELDKMVKRMVLESLGIEHRIEEFSDKNLFSLRLIHYRTDLGDGSRSELCGHTDTGFLSIIKQDLPGLQYQTKTGEWIEFSTSPNSYIVLSADSFAAWSNGRVEAAYHRVETAGDIDRYSIMLFSSPKLGCIIEAPKELVDEEHPLRFKPFEISEYYKKALEGKRHEIRNFVETHLGV